MKRIQVNLCFLREGDEAEDHEKPLLMFGTGFVVLLRLTSCMLLLFQAVPLVIGQFLEMVDNNTGIVGSTTGSNYYVR